jgi:hypothetical protein
MLSPSIGSAGPPASASASWRSPSAKNCCVSEEAGGSDGARPSTAASNARKNDATESKRSSERKLIARASTASTAGASGTDPWRARVAVSRR